MSKIKNLLIAVQNGTATKEEFDIYIKLHSRKEDKELWKDNN